MKKLTKVTGIVGLAIIAICAFVFGLTTFGLTTASAYINLENITLSERDLYNATNTYNINDTGFNEKGELVSDDDGRHRDEQYRISYDMSVKNGNQVMSTTQVTVLTHGLGGSARHWSNNFSENNYENADVDFAYDKESLISRIDKEVGGANIYLASFYNKDVEVKNGKIKKRYTFQMYDITEQKTDNEVYKEDKRIEHIQDSSKHIIIVFDVYDALGSNDNVYYQFNYMMSRVAYDLKELNGGLLPKFNLVGHSRGGITNLQYAMDHPDMVDTLVSLGTPYFGSTTANLFGEMYMDPNDGLDDILDAELYYGYNNRWNDNYDTLYKDINAYAIGSYHTLNSLAEAISNTYDESILQDSWKPLIGVVLGVYNAIKLTPLKNLVDKLLYNGIIKAFGDKIPEEKRGDLKVVLNEEITDDSIPSYVSWYSDLLVPLQSQLAQNGGAELYGGADYKGFNRIIRPFIGGDANYVKVSDPKPPVGHNLEARDSVIINNVLSVLNLGVAGFMFEEKENGTVKIVGYKGAYESNNFIIPEKIDDNAVTEIDRFAFIGLDKSGIEKITLPDTIKTIGMYAFSDFTEVTEVHISSTSKLQTIGQGAFNNCSALQTITFPKNVKTLFGNAFINCESLTSISVDGYNPDYTSVNGVLYNRQKSVLVYYPQGRTDTTYSVDLACVEIGYYAFVGNPNLLTLNLNNVTMIREYGVARCSELQSVVTDKLNYVESGVFGGTKLFDEIDDDIISVGNVLIAYNGNAKDLTVSGDYVSIAPFAFAGNETLETVVLDGNTLTNIGSGAFSGCDNLKFVYINNLNRMVGVSSSTFEFNINNIYVPAVLKSKYDANDIWENYADKISVHTTQLVFESNGGAECPDNVLLYGAYIGELPEPTRRGYNFVGWFENSDYSGSPLSHTDMWKSLADDLTVYAKWTPIQYRLSFVIDAETGATDDNLDRTYTIEDNVVFGNSEKIGYTFGGWYLDSNCTQSAGNGISQGETGDKTYYAKWIAVTIAIKLDVNDSVDFPATVSDMNYVVEYGDDDYSFAVPQRTGFTFNGWYVDINGQKLFVTDADGKSIKQWDIVTGSVDLYADWTRNQYIIRINVDGTITWLGADGFTDIETPIEYGAVFENATEMENSFNPGKISLKDGHKFKYFQLQDGTRFTLWDQIVSRFNPGDIVEIYAVFEKEINFTLDFYGQATDGINNPFVGAYGDGIKYFVASKDGYTFKYWVVADRDNLNDKFIGTILAPGTIFNYTKMPDLSVGYEEDGTHIYLEAVFEANIYTISFQTRHGFIPTSTDIMYGGLKVLPVITANGYKFLGWETNDGIILTDTNGQMISAWNIASNQTLEAKWALVEYTITYVLYDGTNDSRNVTKYTIESPTITLYEAHKLWNSFKGWYDNERYIGNRVYYLPQGSYGDRTLHAKWLEWVTITFDPNNGETVFKRTGIPGESLTLPTVTKDGYKGTWDYWGYLTGNSSVSNFGREYIVGTCDATLKAVWEPYIYTITYKCIAGEEIDTSSLPRSYTIESPTITFEKFTKPGYKLSLMYETIPAGSYGDVTISYYWIPISYYFFSVANGATRGASIENFRTEYGLSHMVTAPDLDGFVFTHWENEQGDFISKNKTVEVKNLATIDNAIVIWYAFYEEDKCIAEGTLITLADGSQKAVEELTGEESLLVWNIMTGAYDVAPIVFIDSDPIGHYEVIKLSFSDGTVVNVISEHGFWDVDLNKYVYLDENAAEYIGHWFVKQGEDGITQVTLTDVEISTEVTTAYSPVTYGHLCYFVNGMLSMPGGIDGFINIFEIDGATMTVDAQAFAADIAEYGVYTYEEFAELFPVPEEVFDAFNGQYLKVAIGKGLITEARIGELIERYSQFF